MERFFVEIPHEEDVVACARAIRTLHEIGSHFLTHADWGCKDGEHKGWMILELGSKDEVRQVLPPAFRSQAKIVKLNKFSIEEIDEILSHHKS